MHQAHAMTAIADFFPLVHRMAPLMALLAAVTAVSGARAETGTQRVRPAVWAGSFYPADASELAGLIDRLTDQAAAAAVDLPAGRPVRALIMPHAGYAYSGLTAAHAARVLDIGRYPKVIVMGPDHRVGFHANVVSDVSAYDTPLGRVPVSGDAAALRARDALFGVSGASDEREHSVEVILPFLQRRLPAFEFIPIVMGPGSPAANAAAISPLVEADTLVIASSDLSHFLNYEQALQRDHETIRAILALDSAYFAARENTACGRSPILTLLELARGRRWHPVLLHYANSGDTAGDPARVVGYCAIAFLGDPDMNDSSGTDHRLSEGQGRALTALARRTIAGELGCMARPSEGPGPPAELADTALQRHCGTFVTLKIDNRLRGCIGNLDSRHSIVEGVKRNAVNAAFHDPRFSPLTQAEFERAGIEVSVLTPPRSVDYRDAADLVGKLRVNVDGLIIRKGSASATFLPQVWEQLPRPEDFLSHLCVKAGLSADAWRRGDIQVQTYQVQYFEEPK